MITKITILSNGVFSPNKIIQLGHKYDNALDTIQFEIPNEYASGFHYYLAFQMKKKPTILLPISFNENGVLEFLITSTVTKNPGIYDMVFLVTEAKIIDGDIDNAKKVFVSDLMQGQVIDNFLKDPITDESLDDNLVIIYESLLNLRDLVLKERNEGDYLGDVFVPNVDSSGTLSWERKDAQDETNITPVNITGNVYVPEINDGVLSWKRKEHQDTDVESGTYNIAENTEKITEQTAIRYLNKNIARVVEKELKEEDGNGKTAIDSAVDKKFKWTWDADTQTLYIEVSEKETIPQSTDGVEF